MNTTSEQQVSRQRRWYLLNRDEHLQRSKQHYEKNKSVRTAQIKAWADANPESRKRTHKRYREANRQAVRSRCKTWYLNNKTGYLANRKAQKDLKWSDPKLLAKEKSRRKKWWKRYYKANKARLSLRVLKRKALKKKAAINLRGIQQFVESVRGSTRVKCYYCPKRISGKSCHFDHIIPLAKGGAHSVENLCVSCERCNLSKKDRTPQAWIKVGQQFLAL